MRDGGIGHDQQIPASNAGFQQLAIRQQPRTDRDGIARMPDVYLKCLHGVDYTKLMVSARGISPEALRAPVLDEFRDKPLPPGVARGDRSWIR
jgi:hypothetical protein